MPPKLFSHQRWYQKSLSQEMKTNLSTYIHKFTWRAEAELASGTTRIKALMMLGLLLFILIPLCYSIALDHCWLMMTCFLHGYSQLWTHTLTALLPHKQRTFLFSFKLKKKKKFGEGLWLAYLASHAHSLDQSLWLRRGGTMIGSAWTMCTPYGTIARKDSGDSS